MKCKKYSYIILLIMMLFISIKPIYANTKLNQMEEKTRAVEVIQIDDGSGTETEVDCETLFGDPDNPDSLRYLINEILWIPRVAVPIIIILLGSLDLGKAVLASNADEMKKAQTKFIKRLIIGVAVFFIPTLIDLLMELADIVWAGTGLTGCDI